MRKLAVFMMFAVLHMAGSAFAATVQSNLSAQANIPASCSITSVTNLNFVDYDATSTTADDDGAGDFTFRCTKNTNYDIYISGARTMTDGTDNLNFELYQEVGRTTAWPSGSPGVTGISPNNAPATLGVYGRIPALQNIGVGAYSGTVSVTISY